MWQSGFLCGTEANIIDEDVWLVELVEADKLTDHSRNVSTFVRRLVVIAHPIVNNLPESDFQKSSGIVKTKNRMSFCVCMCVCRKALSTFAVYVIISLPCLIWSFWCGQAWTSRPGLALNGLLWCVLLVWLITTWPKCYWTEVPMPASTKVRPVTVFGVGTSRWLDLFSIDFVCLFTL